MSRVSRWFMLLSLVTFTFSISPSTLFAFDEPMLSIGTGNITGVYYAAGSAVAKMHNRKRKEYNLRLLAEASEGSVANIQNVTDGTLAFGIAQANALYFSKNGMYYWEDTPVNNLRSVLGLYTEAFTVIAGADAGIQTLADLKGKTVNIGELGSTDEQQAFRIFDHLGMNPKTDLTILERPTYEASEFLQTGKIDAYFYTVGHPNLSVKEAAAGERKIAIISPGQKFMDQFLIGRPYLAQVDIPIDYYPLIINEQPVPTLGVKAILFCNADVDEDIVYHMVREVFENLGLFKQQHPAFANLTPEQLTTGLIIPLHPGAKRYFKEAGLLY